MEEKNTDTKNKNEEQEKKNVVFKEIECIFRWIDSLDRQSLIKNLKKYNQNPNGSAECLKNRLKTFLKKKKLESANIYSDIKTLYPYYVVLDFEATCNEVNPPEFPYEIIEFPAVLVNTEKMAIVDHFQAFVKPVLNPVLSPFCKTLTGITQEQVDDAEEFPAVLDQFEQWLKKHKLGTKNKFAMVTDGPWDMGRFLYLQCILSDLAYPNFGKKWINLRKCFSTFYKCDRLRLQLMLEKMDMEFEGHPHCGLDDATNIARLLIRMIEDGASVDINERIQLRFKLDPKPKQDNNENAANSSNQTSKEAWPVKALFTEGSSRTYPQALRDQQRAADTMAALQAQMKQHHIQASS